MPITIEAAAFAVLALCAIGFLVWTERRHAYEIDRKDRLIADLMDRLMSRDVGEYAMVRGERERPDKTQPQEYFGTEEDNLIGFQMMGEDWKDPERWMRDHTEQIRQAGTN